LTCCCDHGEEYGENATFDDKIISFNYIKYHTEYLNEFRHYRTAAEEREFHNRMIKVRDGAAAEVQKLRSLRPESL
jgi:hypothetical protein